MNDADMAEPPRTIEVTGCPCVLCANVRARRALRKSFTWRGEYARWDQMDPTETVEFTTDTAAIDYSFMLPNVKKTRVARIGADLTAEDVSPAPKPPIPARALRFSR